MIVIRDCFYVSDIETLIKLFQIAGYVCATDIVCLFISDLIEIVSLTTLVVLPEQRVHSPIMIIKFVILSLYSYSIELLFTSGLRKKNEMYIRIREM